MPAIAIAGICYRLEVMLTDSSWVAVLSTARLQPCFGFAGHHSAGDSRDSQGWCAN